MAIVNELGMDSLCGVMGSGGSTVSLSACHLVQVMFESLTEGMKKEIRGKDEAILPGEKLSLLQLVVATYFMTRAEIISSREFYFFGLFEE